MKQSIVEREITNFSKVNVYCTAFESIQEFKTFCDTAPLNNLWKYGAKMQSITGTHKFTQTKSYEEASHLLLNGWTAGAENLNVELKLANRSTHTKEVQKAVFDIVGFQASVPRYLQGIPTNMISKRNVVQKQRVVTLIKGVNYAASVKPEQILKDSIKFIQIVQAIEKKGIRVNIDVLWHTKTNNEEILLRVRIKKANERLNVSKMSYPLLHPSFLRRHALRMLEVEPRITDNEFTNGYGYPGQPNETRQLLNDQEYYVGALEVKYITDVLTDKIN